MKNLSYIAGMLVFCILVFLPALSSGQLSGTYTVNQSQPTSGTNYSSFTELSHALNTQGISGAVTVDVVQGTYNESKVTFADIQGTSASNTITLQAAASNTAQAILMNDTDYVIGLHNLSHFTIDGLTLTFDGHPPVGYDGHVIFMSGFNEEITISRNHLNGVDTNVTFEAMAAIYEYTADTTINLYIDSNTITGGADVIRVYNLGIDKGLFITNNICTGFSHSLVRTFGNDSVVVKNNTAVSKTSGLTSTLYGIYLRNGSDFEVVNNQIELSTTGNLSGLFFKDQEGSANRIALVANNMVSTSGSSTFTHRGINIDEIAYTNIYHNSINLGSGSSSSTAIDLSDNTLSNQGFVEVKNNIFSNSAGGYAIDIDDDFYPDLSGSTVNNNLYYSTGALPFKHKTGTFGSLSAWQADLLIIAGSNVDSASLYGDPDFVSANDLHINNMALNPLALDAGDITLGVTFDIDGDLRLQAPSTTVDIGADEFFLCTTIMDTSTAEICVGDTLMLGNTPISNAGTYTDTLTSSANCDSIVTLIVTLNPLPVVNITDNGGQLIATGGYVSYQWFYNFMPIAGATDSVLMASAPGPFMVEVTDSNGCSQRDTVFVIISIKERGLGYAKLYPNPSSGKFMLDLGSVKKSEVFIFNNIGQVMFHEKFEQAKEIPINLDFLESGIYHVRISSDDAHPITLKLRIQ